MGRPLKIAKAQALVTVTSINGTTEVVTTNANFTNLGIIAGMPFIPASTVGGLVGGTTYWILQVLNAGNNSTFTVSATELSANPTYTPVNLTTAGPVTVNLTVGLVDSGFSNPNGSNTATNSTTYGVVGGNTAFFGSQTLVRVAIGQNGTGTISASTSSTTVTGTDTLFTTELSGDECITDSNGNVLGFVDTITSDTELELLANSAEDYDGAFVFALNEAGYIVRQKGKTKYLVKGSTSGIVAACYTANVANAALTPNTMNIIATYDNSSTKYVQSLNDYNSDVFQTVVTAGSFTPGTTYTIVSVGDTDFTQIGAFTNMTGVTFTATGAGTGTGTAALSSSYPEVIATFGTAYAANTYLGQPMPIVTINNS